MATKKRIKYQSAFITIPNGTPVGTTVEPVTPYKPDADYRNIIGVWARVYNLANAYTVDIQLRDSQGNILIDPMDNELWRGGAGVPPDQMFRKVLMNIAGGSIVKPGAIARGTANVNADINIEIVFMLTDDLIEVVNA